MPVSKDGALNVPRRLFVCSDGSTPEDAGLLSLLIPLERMKRSLAAIPSKFSSTSYGTATLASSFMLNASSMSGKCSAKLFIMVTILVLIQS